MAEPRVSRRLQQRLLAFILLAVLGLAVASLADPSIEASTLLLTLPPAAHSRVAAAFLLTGVAGLLSFLVVGVLRRWRSRVLARAGGLRGDAPRPPRHAPAMGECPARSVPALVQPVPGGHRRLDALDLSAPQSVGSGQEDSIRQAGPW